MQPVRKVRTRRPSRLAAVLALATLTWACERSPDPGELAPEPILRGARLIVGSSVDQWSLLAVPRQGGVVEARSLADPTRVLSTGVADLPPADEAYVLSDGLVILRGSDGAAYTYDPASDALVRAGELPADAVWARGGSVGVFYSPAGSVLEISRQGVWRYEVEGRLHWAVPVEGGVLALLEGETGERAAWLVERDDEQPAETAQIEAGVPGAVTAWGRRVVLTRQDGGGLVVLTVVPIELAGEVALDGTILGLTTSPSTHELYVILDGPPRLESVNRFDLSARTLATFDRVPQSVRPSLFGDAILVGDGSTVHVIPVGGSGVARASSVWRTDLPLGLPDGSLLVGSEAGVTIADPRAGESTALDAAGLDRWWLPVPWSPSLTPVTADRVTGEAVVSGGEDERDLATDSALRAERAAAAPGLRDVRAAPADSFGVPPGFYAIVGSARQREGMQELIGSLEAAGFGARIQSFPDEAGRVWYRGLVGPYRSRSEAEAAARQLLRERRLEAWVTEIGASTRPGEPPV